MKSTLKGGFSKKGCKSIPIRFDYNVFRREREVVFMYKLELNEGELANIEFAIYRKKRELEDCLKLVREDTNENLLILNQILEKIEESKRAAERELDEKQEEIFKQWCTFLNSKGEECEIIVHCNTEEKANKLLEYLDKKNFKWATGRSLKDRNRFEIFKENTCYTSEVTYSKLKYFKSDYYTILEFDGIERYIDSENRLEERIKERGTNDVF